MNIPVGLSADKKAATHKKGTSSTNPKPLIGNALAAVLVAVKKFEREAGITPN